MITRLNMIFGTADGSRVTLSLLDPLDDLTANTVQTAMNIIITKGFFTSSRGDLTSVIGATISTSESTELFTA